VWHPRCMEAEKYAQALFAHLFEDPEDLASHGLRIPIRMWRSRPDEANPPAPEVPPLENARRCAVVVLIDDEFLSDSSWLTFLGDLDQTVEAIEGTDVKLLPVSLNAEVLEVDSPIWQVNAIRLHEFDEELRLQVLLNRVTHALCRLVAGTEKPVCVFLSHAKLDGIKITTHVRDFLRSGTGVEDFFDTQNLTEGTRWADAIQTSARENVLLAIRTDAWATREWCRTEVLEAKISGAPVIVLDALEDRETRGFAYLGNVPCVRWRADAPRAAMEDLLGVVLHETLRFRYFPARVADLCATHGITDPRRKLPTPPELLTVLRLRELDGEESGLLVYPDPPLGTDELTLVSELAPKLDPVTPNELIARR
jgi:hypothetical protein